MTDFLLKIITSQGPIFRVVDNVEFDRIVHRYESRGFDVKIIGLCENNQLVKLAHHRI